MPNETDSEPVIDPDTVLASTIFTKGLESLK
jgi:hypothetical protein